MISDVRHYGELLSRRRLPDGGYLSRPEGTYRCDVTAWAVLALQSLAESAASLQQSRVRLVADQLEDGRVPIHSERRQAAWPTPLCILAWHAAKDFRENVERAAAFLLQTQGRIPSPSSIMGHDVSISGWPWTLGAASWVEPTSLAMLALQAAGYQTHRRLEEGIRMLMNRMHPGGGWNYGNPEVYGETLEPLPETTGMALCALSGRVEGKSVQKSLDYLVEELPDIRTPLSLGWGLLGLSSWNRRPEPGDGWIAECFAKAETADFDTDQLAILVLASTLPGGIQELFSENVHE